MSAMALLMLVNLLPLADRPPEHVPKPALLDDVGRAVLGCYHPSGDVHDVQLTQSAWGGARRYGADRAGIIKVNWRGALGHDRVLYAAVLGRDRREARTVLLSDTASIPASPDCPLEQWTQPNHL
ncbi:hypothetical protein DAI18_07820 [Microvirgula aerodenitrificans]|uniref:Uncharacterized protein n=2 Tax=Aquaspirillaceae TaxID=2897176 RepID=A0A2S0P991_9NEIS|nr:hypothetical protein [Microvirgula aerodenitrificans]AVY93960.1 hypothetical protein DAI18_07820 [Microvirgula aerodenitrificans]